MNDPWDKPTLDNAISLETEAPPPATLSSELPKPAPAKETAFWLLWRQRSFILHIAGIGLVTSILLALMMPNHYQATTRLMPPDTGSGNGLAMFSAMLSKMDILPATVGSDMLGMKSSGALFVEVLKSRTVADALINKFDLRKVYWVRYYADARRSLARNTEITEDRKSGVITITVTDKSPERAKQLANAYVEQLNHLVALLTTSKAHRERVFIEERLKNVKQDLNTAAQALSQFSSRTATIDIKEQSRAMVEAAATLQGQLIAAESELKGLEQIYTSNNVRVRSVQARIAELRKQLAKLGGSSQPVTPEQQDGFDYPSIRQLPVLGVTYMDLYRNTKVQETVYQILTQQYEMAKIEEAREIPTVRVLDIAEKPEKKSSPLRGLVVLTGLMFSLVFGAAWVIGTAAWERMDSQHPCRRIMSEIGDTIRQHQFPRLATYTRTRKRSGSLAPDADDRGNGIDHAD